MEQRLNRAITASPDPLPWGPVAAAASLHGHLSPKGQTEATSSTRGTTQELMISSRTQPKLAACASPSLGTV